MVVSAAAVVVVVMASVVAWLSSQNPSNPWLAQLFSQLFFMKVV